MAQYFDAVPKAEHFEQCIAINLDGRKNFRFYTDNGVFSKDHIDQASEFLIKTVLGDLEQLPLESPNPKVLDLGCAYGFLGIVLKSYHPEYRMYFSDVNHRALSLCCRNLRLAGLRGPSKTPFEVAEKNGKADTLQDNPEYFLLSESRDFDVDYFVKVAATSGLKNWNERFDLILSNPPIRIGKLALEQLFREVQENLTDQGRAYFVIGKKQGAKSWEQRLKTIFSEIELLNKSKGFLVFKCLR